MNSEPLAGISEWPPIDSSAVVYRLMLVDWWIDKKRNKIKAEAFFLRSGTVDQRGLSIALGTEASVIARCGTFDNCYGLGGLVVSEVREVRADEAPGASLDVSQDGSDHANLTGLPNKYNDPTTKKAAERFAHELARLASKQIVLL